MKKLLLLCLLFSISDGFSKRKFDYKGIAFEILQRVTGLPETTDQIKEKAEKLLEESEFFIEEFKSRTNNEEEIVEILKNGIDSLTSLSLKEIEKQWHECEVFSKEGLDCEQGSDSDKGPGKGNFSRIKSLVDTAVHPATVIILLREMTSENIEETKIQIQAEIEEVIKHLDHLD